MRPGFKLTNLRRLAWPIVLPYVHAVITAVFHRHPKDLVPGYEQPLQVRVKRVAADQNVGYSVGNSKNSSKCNDL